LRADVEVPGLKDAIVHQEASTPLTNFGYTRNPNGGGMNAAMGSGISAAARALALLKSQTATG